MTIVVPAYQTVVTNLPGSREHGCQQEKENQKLTDRHPITLKKNGVKLYIKTILNFIYRKLGAPL
jgi:hypothetical protein